MAPGDIVWVPFPFVEAPRQRERPALVVATPQAGQGVALLWVLMITSAANSGWPGDVSLEQCYEQCGLKVPCVIRTAKLATVDARQARISGSIPNDMLALVRSELTRTLRIT